eukprot:1879916-Lingulodinium_polyedra.AAC.1
MAVLAREVQRHVTAKACACMDTSSCCHAALYARCHDCHGFNVPLWLLYDAWCRRQTLVSYTMHAMHDHQVLNSEIGRHDNFFSNLLLSSEKFSGSRSRTLYLSETARARG